MLETVALVAYIMIVVALVLMSYKFVYLIIVFFKKQELSKTEKHGKFAILIPARNESAVIDNLLQSILQQDYDKNYIDVYVVVEDINDETISICKKYGYETFVRKQLHKKGKGHALNEVMQYIKIRKKQYDAFFIFDADNVLRQDFISQMNRSYQMGYDIAIGYRLSKNVGKSWVADCSTLTFTMINTVSNKARSYLKSNIILSGTGFYISSRAIESAGGWKFFELTEDYELSLYSIINNYKTRYVEQAKYYDEQPTTIKMSNRQRTRWIKGYMTVKKKYKKRLRDSLKFTENLWSKTEQLIGIIPLALFVIGFCIYASYAIVGIVVYRDMIYVIQFILAFALLYIALMLFTIVLMIIEGRNFKLKFFKRLAVIFMNPIFMLMYIPLSIKAMLSKDVKWEPIEHNAIMDITNLKK